METSFTQEEENIVSFLESTATRLDRMAEDRNRRIFDHRELGQESQQLGQMMLDSQHRVIELLDIFRTVSHANRLLRRQQGTEDTIPEMHQPICYELSNQQRRKDSDIPEIIVQIESDIQISTPEVQQTLDNRTPITTDIGVSQLNHEDIVGSEEPSNQKSVKKAKKIIKAQVDEINSMSADVYRNIPKTSEGRYSRAINECRRVGRRCAGFFRAVKHPFISCYRSHRETK